ncbi:MAG: cache domain-containing protein [Candidatus Saccharibacteria bacterium]|nr:cache domain-containing protein [Candidatus Saccharibacteria bacterium]
MWLQFFAQNFHFAVNLFAGLASLGVAWLYLDAWSNKHSKKEFLKWLGFGILGFAYLIEATVIEQTVLGSSPFGEFTQSFAAAAKVIGYITIAVGLIMDPLQEVPKNEGITFEVGNDQKQAPAQPVQPTVVAPTKQTLPAVSGFGTLSVIAAPMGSIAIAALYLRRATTGLERHLKPVFWAFALIGISDLASVASAYRDTTNPVFASWFAAFGWVWWFEHLSLALGIFFLGRWVWGYLTERFFSQLFMIFTAMVMMIFLVVGVGFTSLLVNNIQRDTLTKLATAVNVLGYAVDTKKSETTAVAEQLAASSDLASALITKDREKLISLTQSIIPSKQLSTLIITNASGQVILRAEDTSRWGDSLSDDPLIKRALFGVGQSTVSVKQEPGAPVLQVLSAAVIFDSSRTSIGTVMTGLDLNEAFVDRIKDATGLQSSIYGNDRLAATTLVAPDGKTNTLGVKIGEGAIKDTVLNNAAAYQGSVSLQSRQMLAAYTPVKDVDNQVVGALMVAEPRSSVLQIAGRSIQTTFVLAASLLVLSFVPTFFVSRSISRQLE